MPVQRRLAAILAADVAGYARLMGEDEEGTLATLTAHLTELIEPCIADHRGRVVKTTGDGLLAEFASVVDAVKCAVAFQEGMRERNTDTPEDRRIEFRIGVNLGDVIVQDNDVYGDGVNVAARLEGLAEPGRVVVSGSVHEQVKDKVEFRFDDLGPQEVKNIAEPVRIFRIRSPGDTAATSDESLALPDKPSIAVLPFENMSGDPEQEYFADGIAEDITTGLSRFTWFFVIARNSSFTYKGKAVDVTQVARELGVRYVLEGSVRKAGNRVRITAQLVDATANHHIWAQQYDRELHDIFAVQDEITEAITAAVAPEFVSAEARRAERKSPENFDAWDYAMRGNWHFWHMDRESMAESRRLFEAALKLDPKSLIALSGLALACSHQLIWSWTDDREGTRARAVESVQRAVDINETDAWAQTALSLVSTHTGRHDVALRACRRAIELNPNLALAEALLAQRHAWLGNYEEAHLHADRAERLSPRDPANFWWIFPRVVAAFTAGKYEEYRSWSERVTESTPAFLGGWLHLAASNAFLDQPDEAKAAVEQYLRCVPNGSIRQVAAFIPARRPEDKERLLDGLRKAGLPE